MWPVKKIATGCKYNRKLAKETPETLPPHQLATPCSEAAQNCFGTKSGIFPLGTVLLQGSSFKHHWRVAVRGGGGALAYTPQKHRYVAWIVPRYTCWGCAGTTHSSLLPPFGATGPSATSGTPFPIHKATHSHPLRPAAHTKTTVSNRHCWARPSSKKRVRLGCSPSLTINIPVSVRRRLCVACTSGGRSRGFRGPGTTLEKLFFFRPGDPGGPTVGPHCARAGLPSGSTK